MKWITTFIVLLITLCFSENLFAQVIIGEVQDRTLKQPLVNVQLKNVYNNETVYSDSSGKFVIHAQKSELIEVRMAGYRLARIRISEGVIPPYFKLYLDKINILDTNKYASSNLTAYQIDSLENVQLYKAALNFPKMSAAEKFESPFSAFSKHNQMSWKFQENFAEFEKEKFINFSFNADLVSELTGLEGDQLNKYMKRFRPSYEMLRHMTTYEFYNYIKVSAERFRKTFQPNRPIGSG
jgi:hypothetical protein